MEKVIIFGTGDIADIAYYYLNLEKTYEVVAFSVDAKYIDKSEFNNLPLIAFEELSQLYPPSIFKIFIPLGYTDVNKLRQRKFLEAKAKGYSFISYISKNTTIAANATIGENCFIFEDNTIQPFVTIEDNCILWSGNHIGHHSTIKANSFLASHVVVSGGVEIGENSFIGVNATLRDHIKIGKSNVIGAGALILTDTQDNKVYMQKETPCSKVPSNRLRGI